MTQIIAVENCELFGQAPGERFRVGIHDDRVISVTPQSGERRGTDSGNTIDARGRLLVPGFVDAHAHVVEAGVERRRCDMSRAISADEVLGVVRRYAEEDAGDWIVGRGWEWTYFDAEAVTIDMIDRVTGNRPAYLSNSNGHCAWANTAALAVAGITENSVSPAGGRIGRESSGRLTGMLFERAMNLVNDLIPPLSAADKLAALATAEDELHRFGVVAWQEANVGDFVQTTDVLDALLDASESGALRNDVNAALWWPFDEGAGYLDRINELRDRIEGSARVRSTSVKIMLDGTAALRTAALLGLYDDGSNGELFFESATLAEIVSAADSAGIDVHFHANGDRAVRQAIDAVEMATRRNSPRERRHQITHLNFVHKSDIVRMAEMAITAVAQPLWAHPSPKMVDAVLPKVSESTRALIYPFGSLRRAGIRMAFSSDWPVSEPNPWPAIHTAVHRHNSTSVRSGSLLRGERLTPSDAVSAATAGGAHALRREDELGSISKGKKASVALLDRNWCDAVDSLESVRVEATLVNGRLVYEA